MDELLEIIEWEKYNGRKDITNPTWFRLENRIFFDPEWDEFDGQEIAVWHYLLSFASFKKKHIFDFDIDQITNRARVSKSKVESAIKKLLKKQCVRITLKPPTVAVTPPYRVRDAPDTLHNITGQNRTEQDRTVAADASASGSIRKLKEAFFKAFRDEFKRDYPGWGSKENAQAKAWLKSVSLEMAIELSTIYPKWNDPWVTKLGHPFGILISQYVQLDAWAKSSKTLIKKIAAGRAAENIDLKRAIENEESSRGLRERLGTAKDLEDINPNENRIRKLPKPTKGEIPGVSGDPFSDEVFDPAS